jgi:hypothetical protein
MFGGDAALIRDKAGKQNPRTALQSLSTALPNDKTVL